MNTKCRSSSSLALQPERACRNAQVVNRHLQQQVRRFSSSTPIYTRLQSVHHITGRALHDDQVDLQQLSQLPMRAASFAAATLLAISTCVAPLGTPGLLMVPAAAEARSRMTQDEQVWHDVLGFLCTLGTITGSMAKCVVPP